MKNNSGSFLYNLLFDNFSYKVTALFVTVILWVTILGRQDFISSKYVSLEFKTAVQHKVADTTVRAVRFRVIGSRRAIRKFLENPDTILIDLSGVSEVGERKVMIPSDSVELPFGVKVLSVNPEEIIVNLEEGSSPQVK